MKLPAFILAVIVISGCSGMENKYQEDMDRVRISHIDYLETLILEYKSKTGELPLQSNVGDKSIQVFITHRELPDWLVEQTKRLPVEPYTSAALESDIEIQLGRDIQMPSDPQNVATYAPNVYIYHVTKEWACVAGHLYSPTPKTKNIQNRYHKYEVCVES